MWFYYDKNDIKDSREREREEERTKHRTELRQTNK